MRCVMQHTHIHTSSARAQRASEAPRGEEPFCRSFSYSAPPCRRQVTTVPRGTYEVGEEAEAFGRCANRYFAWPGLGARTVEP